MKAHTTITIAHRGLSSQFPENTYSAFSACLKKNVPAIEFDIQLTRDQIPVVIHDRNLCRVSNVPIDIRQLTYQELKQYNIGSWFSSEFSNQRILSYEKLLKLFADSLILFTEIKTYELENSAELNYRTMILIEKVVELSLRYSDIGKFRILCFEPIVLKYIKSLNPNIYSLLNLSYNQFYSKEELESFNGINVEIDELNGAHRKLADDYNLELFCYCCDSEEQLLKAKDIGCDYLLSNRADWLQNILLEE